MKVNEKYKSNNFNWRNLNKIKALELFLILTMKIYAIVLKGIDLKSIYS